MAKDLKIVSIYNVGNDYPQGSKSFRLNPKPTPKPDPKPDPGPEPEPVPPEPPTPDIPNNVLITRDNEYLVTRNGEFLIFKD